MALIKTSRFVCIVSSMLYLILPVIARLEAGTEQRLAKIVLLR